MVNIISVVHPIGPSNSSCGYCSPPGKRSAEESFYRSAGLVAHQLSNSIYQRMIDRGWRRSGTYCYKPHLKASCCPQYTIRLLSDSFKPSKSQRKILNRWNRFVQEGSDDDKAKTESKQAQTKQGKGRNNEVASLAQTVHASEWDVGGDIKFAHKFEVTLEPASFSEEKYSLYTVYQKSVHSDDDSSRSGFTGFLCNSPLRPAPIPYEGNPAEHLPKTYGSYHQMYRLDGKLIAIAVLDILPKCVSSVYFMYNPEYEKFSFGKLSAFREIVLTQEMHAAGAAEMQFLYLGFYIHSCIKMRYKGDYSPSFLADPETYEWFPLEHCKSILDNHRYATFSDPTHCVQGPATYQMKEEVLEHQPEDIPSEALANTSVVTSARRGVVYTEPLQVSEHWQDEYSRREIACCIEGLGLDVAQELLFTL